MPTKCPLCASTSRTQGALSGYTLLYCSVFSPGKTQHRRRHIAEWVKGKLWPLST